MLVSASITSIIGTSGYEKSLFYDNEKIPE